MTTSFRRTTIPLALAALGALGLSGCNKPQAPAHTATAAVAVTSGPGGAWTNEPAATQNLVRFDTLD
ncbi:MAG: hypothetical protein ACREEG_14500, partial [Phenylobacterium sp.]